jgi:hypothetical protein
VRTLVLGGARIKWTWPVADDDRLSEAVKAFESFEEVSRLHSHRVTGMRDPFGYPESDELRDRSFTEHMRILRFFAYQARGDSALIKGICGRTG